MNKLLIEVTHDTFCKRMDAERVELVREMREGHYLRAAGIAEYIRNELRDRAKAKGETKQ